MRIRVLTYNIHRAIGVDRSFRPERIIEILAHHDPDLVLLQEVDDGVPRSRNLDLARELAEQLGYPHRAVGHNVNLRKGRYGNATLSRFPIERERNIDLTIGKKKRRGCQHTTIRIGEGGTGSKRLEVFNLHLGLSARERRQQIGLMASSQEFSSLQRDAACIVGGDFNDWRSLLREFFVEVLGFDCATESLTVKGRSPIRTYPSFSPRGPLDRLYFRGSVERILARRCRLRISKVASDHLPVIAEFELS